MKEKALERNKRFSKRGREPKKKLGRATTFDWINGVFLTLFSLVMIFPLYHAVIVSFGRFEVMADAHLYILPLSFTLEWYRFIFIGGEMIVNAFFVSVFVTVVGTLTSMLLSVALAYGVSKKKVPFAKVIMFFIVITLFFDAGLIPYYITIMSYGMIDSLMVMFIPTAISAFNVILLRNYFQSLPPSLEESARMDGANDMVILIKIILPISMPIIATISLFYAVAHWNDWWHAFMFINSPDRKPLQLILREILANFQQVRAGGIGQAIIAANRPVFARSIQMATVVVATVPIMLVYPFLQKHFNKGIMLGAVKG